MVIYSRLAAAGLALAAARPLAAQTLTLAEAFRRADRAAYGNRAAAARTTAAAAQATAALRGALPAVRLEAGYLRTTEQVGAFAAVLRQRTASPAAFDPARLNDPAAIGDYSASLVLEQPLFNADALFGRAAARRAGAAATAAGRWTRETTRADVVRAFFGAALATDRVRTLEAAARAAHDHVRQAEALAANGLVTRSDALLAAVKAGEVDVELAEARADAAMARLDLAVLLGSPDDTTFALPAELPAAERLRALPAATSPTRADRPSPPINGRGDVEAARLGMAAARADARRARALYLPRLSGFARYDWHDPSAPLAGTPSWTVGVFASWAPFTGASEIAATRAARGREAEARALAEAAGAEAALDVERTAHALEVALQRLAIAEQAVTQAAEAHRIVTRKYDGGLATVIELLDAAAAETGTRLRHSSARYDLIVAEAARRLARGLPLDDLTSLDH